MRQIAIDPDPVREDSGLCKSRLTALRGLASSDGKSWFEPSDPFANRLELMLAQFGDDYAATLFYGGIPMLVVTAGFSYDENHQYHGEWICNLGYVTNDLLQQVAAFGETFLGFPEESVVRVAEGATLDQIYEESEGQGYEEIEMIGIVARAMHAACPDELPAPQGF